MTEKEKNKYLKAYFELLSAIAEAGEETSKGFKVVYVSNINAYGVDKRLIELRGKLIEEGILEEE